MPYLNDKTQNSIIKALHIINEGLKSPIAFEQNENGKAHSSLDFASRLNLKGNLQEI